MDESSWDQWVGRTQVLTDRISATPARALAATFDRSNDLDLSQGAVLPGLWIWLFFLPIAPSAEIGPDGHPRRGGFLPPIELPRRMWAGSRCVFYRPILIGDTVERRSTIASVTEKSGKAGTMVFVTVRHGVSRDGVLLMEEDQDIVYLRIPDRFVAPAPTPLPPCAWSDSVKIDPVLLFRFSALTFNAHRIHYDRTYASEVEKYPGLVIHGPLQAALLFDAACRREPQRTPARFEFRGVRPLFDFEAISVNGRPQNEESIELFTANADNLVGMQAKLDWSSA